MKFLNGDAVYCPYFMPNNSKWNHKSMFIFLSSSNNWTHGWFMCPDGTVSRFDYADMKRAW